MQSPAQNENSYTGDQHSPGGPDSENFQTFVGSQEPFFNPKIDVIRFDINNPVTSLLEPIAEISKLRETFLDPESQLFHQVVSSSTYIDVLSTYLEAAGVIPPRINLKVLEVIHGNHPAFDNFSRGATKGNDLRTLVQQLVYGSYKLLEDICTNQDGILDIDALTLIVDSSDKYISQADLLKLFIEFEGTYTKLYKRPPEQPIKDAERVLRVMLLGELEDPDNALA